MPTAHAPCPTLQYFGAKKSLPGTAYWHGVVRNGTTFTFADGSPVPNNYSTSPYSHWAYTYHTKLAQGGLACVSARGSLAYDYFIGDGSMLALKVYYSSSSDNKYG